MAEEGGGRLALAERLINILRALTFQNVLTLGLLVCVAVPAYFAWQFMHDDKFRHEFMSSIKVVEMNVPCLVLAASFTGAVERYSVMVAYESDGRLEHSIVIRSPGIMSATEIAKACEMAGAEAVLMRQTMDQTASHPTEGK